MNIIAKAYASPFIGFSNIVITAVGGELPYGTDIGKHTVTEHGTYNYIVSDNKGNTCSVQIII